jgi:hypothetical protein
MNRIAPDMAFRPEPLFRPLSATVGAEVPGLDLRDPLEPAAVEALKDGLAQHGVLLFRDQQLDVDAQVRFARYFGDLSGGYIGQTSEKRFGGQTGPTTGKQVMYVGNLTVDGEQGVIPTGELMFHADGLYTETPALLGRRQHAVPQHRRRVRPPIAGVARAGAGLSYPAELRLPVDRASRTARRGFARIRPPAGGAPSAFRASALEL